MTSDNQFSTLLDRQKRTSLCRILSKSDAVLSRPRPAHAVFNFCMTHMLRLCIARSSGDSFCNILLYVNRFLLYFINFYRCDNSTMQKKKTEYILFSLKPTNENIYQKYLIYWYLSCGNHIDNTSLTHPKIANTEYIWLRVLAYSLCGNFWASLRVVV